MLTNITPTARETALTKLVAEVIDSRGLSVSQTILADSLRLEPFAGQWVAKFEGAVWLTDEQMHWLCGGPEPHTSEATD